MAFIIRIINKARLINTVKWVQSLLNGYGVFIFGVHIATFIQDT
jgi:hypothetical protein